MTMKILSEHMSENGNRHATVKLADDHFVVDFYINNDYQFIAFIFCLMN